MPTAPDIYAIFSDRKICRTCPADFCRYRGERSDLAGHSVQQGSTLKSIHIKCPKRKTRMTIYICQSSLVINWKKMSVRGSKCAAEHLRLAWHTWKFFRDHFIYPYIMYMWWYIFRHPRLMRWRNPWIWSDSVWMRGFMLKWGTTENSGVDYMWVLFVNIFILLQNNC